MLKKRSAYGVAAAAIVFLFLIGSASAASQPADLLLILDASGSMWQKVDDEFKIVIARRVLKDLVGELPDGSQVGLVAYGHRRKGDCEDIETIAPLAPLEPGLGARIDALNPTGMTPITASIQQALEIVRSRERATTVILVSDGLETCGGDPCAVARAAKEAGLNFVMHVVGFDVGEVDVSQLECTAQAAGGLYVSAQNADELGKALEAAVAVPADIPASRISVKTTAEGGLKDSTVRVTDFETGEEVAGGRTYASEQTNPRVMPVAPGAYRVEVTAVALKGDVRRVFEKVEVAEGETVERVADFSAGEISVRITRNGVLSDAAVNLTDTEGKAVAGGRTYKSENSNPTVLRVTPGIYDLEIRSVEIDGDIRVKIPGVVVEAAGRAEQSYDFISGTLKVGARKGGELLDVTLNVVDASTGRAVAGGRTYASPNSNPKTFTLVPGTYRVTLTAVRLEGRPRQQIEVTVAAGGMVERVVDF